MWINLAVETRIWLDEDPSRQERDRLLRFYDTLPSHDAFKRVDRAQFCEVQSRCRNDRKKAKRRDDRVLQEDFVSMGAPPNPKAVSRKPEAGAREELDEDDQENSSE